jgi:hypothetical protein
MPFFGLAMGCCDPTAPMGKGGNGKNLTMPDQSAGERAAPHRIRRRHGVAGAADRPGDDLGWSITLSRSRIAERISIARIRSRVTW